MKQRYFYKVSNNSTLWIDKRKKETRFLSLRYKYSFVAKNAVIMKIP